MLAFLPKVLPDVELKTEGAGADELAGFPNSDAEDEAGCALPNRGAEADDEVFAVVLKGDEDVALEPKLKAGGLFLLESAMVAVYCGLEATMGCGGGVLSRWQLPFSTIRARR